MSLFEVKHLNGSVLFSLETTSMKLCVEAAVKSGSDLSGSDLRGSNLRGSNLRGAKTRSDITVIKPPIQVLGLEWLVTIWDQHMQIGCEFHSHEEWRNFIDEEWLMMGGKSALEMKRKQFQALIVLCDQHRLKE